MAGVTMAAAFSFAVRASEEAGDAMEATFSSAKSGDFKEALILAKEAVDKALNAKKALATALKAQHTVDQDIGRAALGHVEEARLFAKAAMDVARAANRRALDAGGGPPGKKSAETMAFLMATASLLLDIKRGGDIQVSLRKVALAAERAAQAADDAAKAGGAANKHAEDAIAGKTTAQEIARRAPGTARDVLRSRGGSSG
jgi:hypothetical protein